MKKIRVEWRNLKLSKGKDKTILHKSEGVFEPGTVTAVMGASGSGKTSFLNAFTGRISLSMKLEGEILSNGKPRDHWNWPFDVSYVNHEFPLHSNLTVFETLKFNALFKYDNIADVDHIINNALHEFEIETVRDDKIKSLSSGEIARVAIAIECIKNPSVWFLDEPTSGLDTMNAYNIIKMLNKMARKGKTVVFSLHQPSTKILTCIDNVLLLQNGRVVFSGPLNDCEAQYSQLEHSLSFLEYLNECNFSEPMKNTVYRIEYIEIENEQRRPVLSLYNKLLLLTKRELIQTIRNTSSIKAKIVNKTVIGLIYGLSYYNLGQEISKQSGLRQTLSFLVINELFNTSNPIFNDFNVYKKILKRERLSGMYNGFEAYFSKLLSVSLFYLFFEIPYIFFVYWLIGFEYDIIQVLFFMFIVCQMVLFSISFGISFGVIFKSTSSAQSYAKTICIIFLLYSGSFIKPQDMPESLKWLRYFSPGYYAFGAAIRNHAVNDTTAQQMLGTRGRVNSLIVYILLLCLQTLIYQLVGAWELERKIKNNLKITKVHETRHFEI